MRLIFHSDLDNTLIYSYKRDIGADKVCVELYQGREVSYMTRRSCELLKGMGESLVLVPTTTRTREQYERIDLGIKAPRYALVCNGGVLLEHGKENEDWYRESLSLIKKSRPELQRAELLMERDQDRCFEVRNIRDLFLFTKSRKPEETVNRLREKLTPSLVEVFQNGMKVYAVPIGLDKGTAVRRFRRRMHADRVLAAGDSAFDLPMLREADTGLAPEALIPFCTAGSRIAELRAGTVFSDRVLEYVLAEMKRGLT